MSFQHTPDAGVSLTMLHSLNAIVNLVFADDRGRLVVTDLAVKSFELQVERSEMGSFCG